MRVYYLFKDYDLESVCYLFIFNTSNINVLNYISAEGYQDTSAKPLIIGTRRLNEVASG